MDSRNWLRSYVIQVIPLIYLLVYVLGFAYYITYYGMFGINIVSYITLSEVLVSSLALVILCSIIAFLFYTIVKIYFQRSIKEIDRKTSMKPIRKASTALQNIISKMESKSLRKRMNGYLFTAVASNGILIWLIFRTNLGHVNNRILLIPMILSYIICMVDIYRHYSLLPFYKVRNFYYTITSCINIIGLLTSLIVLGIRDSESIINEEPYYFELRLSNELKIGYQQYSYIGDTATTIFLYDRKNSKSVILTREHVISITLNRDTLYKIYSPNDSIKNRIMEEGVKGYFKSI